jgi:hypothetical protein
MIKVPHPGARASRPMPAAPGASPALTPELPDAGRLRSDRRPGLPLRKGLLGQEPAVPARLPVPLRRKRPAGTRGSGDIDKPSAVTERARSIGDRAASEIDAPGPCLTPTCGGRTRRPRTEEWPLPDPHPRSRRQLGALDPRSPITEEGLPRIVAISAGAQVRHGPNPLFGLRNLASRLVARLSRRESLPSEYSRSALPPEPRHRQLPQS